MSAGLVIDAAYPPTVVPAVVTGVMGYIGGTADHTWTPGEWKPFSHLRQFPVWVPYLKADPVVEATDAVRAAAALGWAAHEADTRVIVCDLELAQDPAWYQAWAAIIAAHGFVSVAYGSLSTVLGNRAENNIIADWDDLPEIPAGQTINGVQFRANVPLGLTTVDYSMFGSWLMARGGVGPRHGA